MPFVSIIFGLLLCGLGGYAYHASEYASKTALIPAIPGLLLIITGALALNESFLKHAMHTAALVGVLAFLAGAGNLGMLLSKGEAITSLKSQASGGMAALSLVFVAACVNSFIQARRRKAQAEAAQAQPS
jgi:hypothetical protein